LTPKASNSKMARRENFGRKCPKAGMAQESNAMEQAVARAVRDNLERIQRTSDELHDAVRDVVAACSSNKPTNALPPLLRAQTASASLSASLEVLSRFIAVALQPGPRSPIEAEISRLASAVAVEAPPAPPEAVRPAPSTSKPMAAKPAPAPAPAEHLASAPHPTKAPAHVPPPIPEAVESEPLPPSVPEITVEEGYEEEFDVNRLSPEEQELHRRANRVAKVSMQDIKMLRPEQVRLGRQHKDLCIRLKDDIEKAHREYDRRFKPIMDHPVDYFYRWLVEILAEGDASALGEYPYAPSAKPQ
jgi:hypothetical protein